MRDDWRELLDHPFRISAVDEVPARPFRASNIQRVILERETGNQFDGRVYCLVELDDGRFAAVTLGNSNLAPPWVDQAWVGATLEAVSEKLPKWVRG